MITLDADELVFRFPEVHAEATCSVSFQRTLRIPDDGKRYPLPPGLGNFPLRHLDDYARRLPQNWLARGGVILPMHQAEAMWINFDGGDYPFAVKIATGKICAVTGAPWVDHLNRDPQDYVVLPRQPWLDGYCVEKGVIRQFVAMPLGEGYTVEEQITGAAEHGGVQIVAYPMKRERFEIAQLQASDAALMDPLEECMAIGLAPGGRIRQEIFDDHYGLDAWDQRHSSRCFVSIANSATWTTITGERPPTEPPTAAAYTKAGLPWFEYYGGDNEAVAGAKKLAGLRSVAEMGKKKSVPPLPENESVDVRHINDLGRGKPSIVRESSGETDAMVIPPGVQSTTRGRHECLRALAQRKLGLTNQPYYLDIVEVLLQYPPHYKCHRSEVIEGVKRLRTQRGQTLPLSIESTVQRSFQDFSSEAARFDKGTEWDFFRFAEGKGFGYWALNVGTVEDFLDGLPEPSKPLTLEDF